MPLQRQHSYRIGKLVYKKGGQIEVLAEPQGIVVNAQCLSAQIFLARAPTNLNSRSDVFYENKLLVTDRRLRLSFRMPIDGNSEQRI